MYNLGIYSITCDFVGQEELLWTTTKKKFD